MIGIFAFISINVFGSYTIGRFDNEWCTASYPTAYVTGSFSITETDYSSNNGNDGLTKNQSGNTIQIDLPAGFEFKTSGTTASVTASGTEITIVSFSFPSATRLLVTLNTYHTNLEYNTIFFDKFEIRATVSGASGYMSRTGGTFKIDNSASNPTSVQPFGIFTSQTPFAYSSSAVAQLNTGTVSQYSINNEMLRINVNGNGGCGTTLTQFTFSTDGGNGTGTDTTYNISTAKVYFTGSSSVFSDANFYGSCSSPSGSFVITGSNDLSNGDNYFWLTYDVPGDAYTDIAHNKLDASLSSFVINGITKADMSSPTSFAYRTVIPAAYYFSRFSGNWTDANIWAKSNNGASCGCQPNGAGVVIIDTGHVITMNKTRKVDVVEIRKSSSLRGNSSSLVFMATTALNTYDDGYFYFSGDINVTGNVRLNGTGTSEFHKNFNIDGDLYISSGTTMKNSTASSLDLTIGGNLTVNGILQDAATNNIVLYGGFAYIDGTDSITDANNIIIKNGNKVVNATASLYIESNIFIQGGNVLDNYGHLNVRGNIDADNASAAWINEADSYLSYGGSAQMFNTYGVLDATANNNTVSYSGTSAQSIVQSDLAHYYHLKLEGSNTKTLLSDIHIYGDLTANTSFLHNGKIVTFHGAQMQYIYGTVPPTLYDMVMLNSSTGLTLMTPVYFDGNLTLTSGKIFTTLTNILTANDNATSTGGSTVSYVNGPMKKVGNDDFVYPVGKNDVYARLGITAPLNVLSEFIAEYFDHTYSNTSSVITPINHVSTVEYWTLLRNFGTDSVKIKLYWESAARSGINSFTNALVVSGWNGSAWVNIDQSAIKALDPGNVTSKMANTFIAFTFGSKSAHVNPLPIEFLTYNAVYSDGKTYVTWSTASETNNDYYTIEKTKDLNTITVAGIVDGSGNSNVELNYQFIDYHPENGLIFYRIRQTDFDGGSSSSSWMPVEILSDNDITVALDNNAGGLLINFNTDDSNYNIDVYDITGNDVIRNIKKHENENSLIIPLHLTAKGIYIVKIYSKSRTIIRKIVFV